MIRLAALALGLALAAAPAAASEVDNFTAAVPGLAGKSWLDLLRQLFPDIAPGAMSGAVLSGEIRLRPIEKEAFGGECPDPLPLQQLEYQRATIAGKPRLIVGVGTGSDLCVAPLALFEGDGEGKLLDAADVKQDAHYFFASGFVRPLGAGGQLVVASNNHEGSGGGYEIETLVMATDAAFSYIGSLFVHNERSCRTDADEQANIRTAPDAGPFARIVGEVKRTAQYRARDCETPSRKDTVTITRTVWRWNAARHAYRKVAK